MYVVITAWVLITVDLVFYFRFAISNKVTTILSTVLARVFMGPTSKNAGHLRTQFYVIFTTGNPRTLAVRKVLREKRNLLTVSDGGPSAKCSIRR